MLRNDKNLLNSLLEKYGTRSVLSALNKLNEAAYNVNIKSASVNFKNIEDVENFINIALNVCAELKLSTKLQDHKVLYSGDKLYFIISENFIDKNFKPVENKINTLFKHAKADTSKYGIGSDNNKVYLTMDIKLEGKVNIG